MVIVRRVTLLDSSVKQKSPFFQVFQARRVRQDSVVFVFLVTLSGVARLEFLFDLVLLAQIRLSFS